MDTSNLFDNDNDDINGKRLRRTKSKHRSPDAPSGITCPYCNIRECERTTVINKHLTWLCDVCFREILEYEQKKRNYQT